MSEITEITQPGLRFSIRSTDENVKDDVLFRRIRERRDDLRQAINQNAGGTEVERVEVKLEKRFGTGLAEAMVVAFLVGVAKGAGEATGKKAAPAILSWIKDEFNDVEIIELGVSGGPTTSDDARKPEAPAAATKDTESEEPQAE
jgi:hypothetical protein